MNNVQIIAPTKVDSIFDKDLSESRVKRVAAYCRVSTDSEEQSTSFNNQIEEWTKRILENPDYQLVKVYADEGISGTSAKGRNGFNQMIKDAKAGKIDLILVKSISRFARNTVLTIQTIRELKEIGVEVYFDNERLSTFDAKNERESNEVVRDASLLLSPLKSKSVRSTTLPAIFNIPAPIFAAFVYRYGCNWRSMVFVI